MPSIITTHITLAAKNLSLAFLTVGLISCGGGSSSGSATSSNNSGSETVLKENEIEVRFPFEFRNVDLKLVDFLTNQVVAQTLSFSGNSQIMTFPIQKANQLYRLEIVTRTDSQVYNPVTDSYNDTSTDPFQGTYRAFIFPTFQDRRSFVVSPISNMIYERTLVRAGQLYGETLDPHLVKPDYLTLAANDVNAALTNAFSNTNIPLMSKGNLALAGIAFSNNSQLYYDAYSSYGLFNYWYSQKSNLKTFQSMTENLTTDLLDGYLDGRTITGKNDDFVKVVTTVENTDPSLNNAPAIANTQKTARENFASALRNATVNLAEVQRQNLLNPKGYTALQNYSYVGKIPLVTATQVRTSGAGDYRLAVGFTNSTEYCPNSPYLCKRGLVGINSIQNKDFPSIEYLIGKHTGTTNTNSRCILNVRPEGQFELKTDSETYTTSLNSQTKDNLLQVNATTHEYLLNVGDESMTPLQYNFIQLHIINNQIISATYGASTQEAPDNLDIKTLQCSFNSI